jgi:hypothetical protein
MDLHVRQSSYREKLVEHLFVGELLRHLWCRDITGISVLRPEVDNAGFDIVLTYGHTVRHVQLKCSRAQASTARQNIHVYLAAQPSGCVVWLVIDDQLEFVRFGWFGAAPGQPLSLDGFKTARHTKGDATGFKAPRPSLRSVPVASFTQLPNMAALIQALFGVPPEIPA